MQFGEVIGNVVSTRKTGKIEGLPLLVVRLLNADLNPLDKTVVCTDTVNARPGDLVLTVATSSARATAKTRDRCTDRSITAIVDLVSVGKTNLYDGALPRRSG